MERKESNIVRIPSFGSFTRESVLNLSLAMISPNHAGKIKVIAQDFFGKNRIYLGDIVVTLPSFFDRRKGGAEARALLAWLLARFGLNFGTPENPDSIDPTSYFREGDFPRHGDWLKNFFFSCGKRIVRVQNHFEKKNRNPRSECFRERGPS